MLTTPVYFNLSSLSEEAATGVLRLLSAQNAANMHPILVNRAISVFISYKYQHVFLVLCANADPEFNLLGSAEPRAQLILRPRRSFQSSEPTRYNYIAKK